MKSRYKIIVLDMDGTLTSEPNSWGLIHSKLGVQKEAAINAELFFSKKIDYTKWAELDVDLWKEKGLKYAELKKIIEDDIKPIKGAKETIDILKKMNIETLVISSGLDLICEYFKKLLNFDHYISNKLIFNTHNSLLQGILINVGFNKDQILLNYIQGKYALGETISVGDNVNDITLFKTTNVSIAFNPKDDSVASSAKYQVYSDNLLDILKYIEK